MSSYVFAPAPIKGNSKRRRCEKGWLGCAAALFVFLVVSVKIQQKARVKDEERKGIVVDSGGELEPVMHIWRGGN